MNKILYELVDIGANLCHPLFKNDFNEMLMRAKEAGIIKMLITGTSESVINDALKLSSQHPSYLYYTAGIHPHDAKEFSNEYTLNFLTQHLTKNLNCVAIGECGLDFNRNFSTKEQQIHAFEKQVELACKLNKPLFVHEREAHKELVEILSKYKPLPPVVIHCFTGTADEAIKYIDMGFYIGLTGFLWKDKLENGVKYALKNGFIPLKKLLLETDAPYMFPKINDKKIPIEIRSKLTEKAIALHKFSSFNRNEPSSLAAICELIAAYMNISPIDVAKYTTNNAKSIFNLS